MKRWFLAGGTVAVVLMLATFNQNSPIMDNNEKSESTSDKNSATPKKVAPPKEHSHHNHEPGTNDHQDLPEELKKVLIKRLKNNTKSDDLEIINLPEGGKMTHLKGRFQHVPVAIKNPDGSVTIKEFYTAPENKE